MKKHILSFSMLILLFVSVLPADALAYSSYYDIVLDSNKAVRNVEIDENRYLSMDDAEMKRLSDQIIADAGAETDYEKAKAIHDWMKTNMYYDYDQYYSGDYILEADGLSTYELLIKYKRGVCSYFAEIFSLLVRAQGIPCMNVVGYAENSDAATESFDGYLVDYDKQTFYPSGDKWTAENCDLSSNHEWNEVFLNGKWVIVDVTWDTQNQYLNGVYQEAGGFNTYFDIPIEIFSFDHRIISYGKGAGVPVTGVQISRETLSLMVEETYSLTAAVFPSDADNQNVVWSSSDETVATVDQDGLVRGVSAGTTQISVRTEDGGFAAGCMVTVEEQEELVDIPFTDVPDDAWYRKAVGYAWENSLFSGTSDTTFSPETGMTRGMFVTVLGRKTGIDTADYMRYRFLDTKLGEYYAPYVEWAAEYGIVSGTSKTSFSPNQKITREQMAAILYRYAQKTGNDTSYSEERYYSFSDTDKVSDYAKTAMMWVASQGILNGSKGKLTPKGTAARAQVAQVFFNCRNLLKSTAVSGEPVLVPEPKLNPVPIHKLANYQSLSKGMSAAEFQQAYNEALKIVEDLNGYNKQSQLLNIAVRLRTLFDSGIEYSMTAPHYADAYGYFISKKASCAGCTRATGLCLNILGYPYEHVNEGAWSHQWCRVRVGSEYWICDAFGLCCGPEPAPYRHPYLS